MRLNQSEIADIASALAATISREEQMADDYELHDRRDVADRFRAIAARKRALLSRLDAQR